MTISYIIVCRNPGTKKLVVVCMDDGPAEFDTEEKALGAAKKIALCRAWGAEIVPVDPPTGE